MVSDFFSLNQLSLINLTTMSANFYSKTLRKKYNFFGNWEPGAPIELGDIGVLDKYTFTRLGHLSHEGIDFETITDNKMGDLSFQSEKGINVLQKASGEVSPKASTWLDASAGYVIEFTSDNAILFQAKETLTHSIDNQIALAREIEARFNSKEESTWKKSWVVVTQIVTAKKGTVIVSQDSNGKLELKAKGDAGWDSFDLVDLDGKFELNKSQFSGFLFEANEEFTPLFKLSGIRKGWFSKEGSFTSRSTFDAEEREGFMEIEPEEE